MRTGDLTICDHCGASVGEDVVTLRVEAPATPKDRSLNGWIAHFHPDCYIDRAPHIDDAAQRMPEPPADSVGALNAIPVAREYMIMQLRDAHRLDDGRTVSDAREELRKALAAVGLNYTVLDKLNAAGIELVEDLAQLDDHELRAIRGIGPKTLRAIRAVVPRALANAHQEED